MAKKKSRSANVARKREKRNRNRKSKNKQRAAEKQRKQAYGYAKMDEERLEACLMKSRDLLNEPEFEEIHFDIDLMYNELFTLMEHNQDLVERDVIPEIIRVEPEKPYPVDEEALEFDELCEQFRTVVLRRLITPKFMRTLQSALTACEKRLKQTGDRDLAEVAYVSYTLFEVMPPHIAIEHPLIMDIGLKTIAFLVDAPFHLTNSWNAEDYGIIGIASGMLEAETAGYPEGELSPILSDAIVQESPLSADTVPVESESTETALPSPETLPAKAIYKNFDGMAMKTVLKAWREDFLEDESDTQLDLFDETQELYISMTENRIQLYAQSAEKLDVAMQELEEYCQSGIMYLAKTVEEGGDGDAT